MSLHTYARCSKKGRTWGPAQLVDCTIINFFINHFFHMYRSIRAFRTSTVPPTHYPKHTHTHKHPHTHPYVLFMIHQNCMCILFSSVIVEDIVLSFHRHMSNRFPSKYRHVLMLKEALFCCSECHFLHVLCHSCLLLVCTSTLHTNIIIT